MAVLLQVTETTATVASSEQMVPLTGRASHVARHLFMINDYTMIILYHFLCMMACIRGHV